MTHRYAADPIEKTPGAPGFVAYLVIVMWFLLTVMASSSAKAAQTDNPARQIVVSAADILPDIETALTARGLPPGAEIMLNAPDAAIVVDGDVAIAHVSYNSVSGRFAVRLHGAAAPVTGVARPVESFPVLTRAIRRGEIIEDADIVFMETADARADVFLRDADALAGKQARRPLAAGAPLRASDVAAPVLVKKGALVTLTFAIEGLRLSHQGVALASGGDGDVISVRNVQSDRVLKAVVAGENIARVAAPRAHPSNFEG